MPDIRLEIWDPSNTVKLGDLWTTDNAGRQRNFDELADTGWKLNEAGAGGFTVQQDHPIVAQLAKRNVVRLTIDGTPVFPYRIDSIRKKRVTKRQKHRTLQISGSGLLGREFDKVRVAQWRQGRPNTAERVWNWASPPLDTTGWSSSLTQQTRTVSPHFPAYYPISPLYAGWVLTRADSQNQPLGDCLFRRPFTVAAATDAVFFLAADDTFEIWVDGVLIERNAVIYPDVSGWSDTWRYVVPLSSGSHTLAIKTTNYGGAHALIASAFEVNGQILGAPFFSTGPGSGLAWRSLDYPDPKPGFTAPQILGMLFTEAQTRGALTGWSIQTHGSHPNIEEFSVRLGTSYRQVLDLIAAQWCDMEPDMSGLKLHLYPKDGLGSASGTTAALTDLEHFDDLDIENAVEVIWADDIEWRQHNGSISTHGRHEGTLTLGAVKSLAAARKIADDYLAVNAFPVESYVGSVLDQSNVVAGVDYSVGDTQTVDGQTLRCSGLTWNVARNGDAVPYVEWESPVAIRRRQLERAVERSIQAFDEPASAPLLSMNRMIIAGKPSTEAWSWSWSDDIEDALNEVDPEKPWQVKRVEKLRRLSIFEIEIDPADLPDAWGDTTVTIMKNGVELNVLYRLKLNTLVAHSWLPIWGYEVVRPDDRLQVACLESGGHVDGRITLTAADAL